MNYYVEEIKYNIAKRYMRFSSNAPLVYLTYSILQKVEIDNLKHIIEGIRYKRDASSIRRDANLCIGGIVEWLLLKHISLIFPLNKKI